MRRLASDADSEMQDLPLDGVTECNASLTFCMPTAIVEDHMISGREDGTGAPLTQMQAVAMQPRASLSVAESSTGVASPTSVAGAAAANEQDVASSASLVPTQMVAALSSFTSMFGGSSS